MVSSQLKELLKKSDYFQLAKERTSNLKQAVAQLDKPHDAFDAAVFVSALEQAVLRGTSRGQMSDRFFQDRNDLETRNEMLMRTKAMLGAGHKRLSELSLRVQKVNDAYTKLESVCDTSAVVRQRVDEIQGQVVSLERDSRPLLAELKEFIARKHVALLLEQAIRQHYVPLARADAAGDAAGVKAAGRGLQAFLESTFGDGLETMALE